MYTYPLVFDPPGQVIVSSSEDGVLQFWDFESRLRIGHSHSILNLLSHPLAKCSSRDTGTLYQTHLNKPRNPCNNRKIRECWTYIYLNIISFLQKINSQTSKWVRIYPNTKSTIASAVKSGFSKCGTCPQSATHKSRLPGIPT